MHPTELITPSKTLQIDSLAKKLKSEGKPVINLTAGEPDFQTPRPIVEKAFEALEKGLTKYTDSDGIPELRHAISEYLKTKKGVEFSPDEIVVSNGGKQALFNAFAAILDEGDEVLLFAPYWVSYPAQIHLVRGKPVVLRTRYENGFVPTKEEILQHLSPRTKAIVVNSPNNPSGVIYTQETLETIAHIANENNVYVVTDEVYDELVYVGTHRSLYGLVKPELLIYVNAFSKSHAMTGWRVGYTATKNKEIKKRVSKIQSHVASNINTIAQYAAIEACKTDNSYMIAEFKKRCEFVVNRAKQLGLEFVEPKGAFYLFFKVDGDDEEFCHRLLEEKMVATVPGSAFDMPGFVRISFATSLENLEEGFRRLEEFLNS
ncbi:aspartate aminotransferase [Fervidobacterium thailandense]|uniref:Aspartate aminotransferase n=1 Tax=Fervidobacterium thailandense TaxID=1008305 RepID=A0A1E3G4Z8_9BACT|nr:aspartate aminotransferase [Fervidobacterium thailandense]ODN31327.1 aspartate aminotransferase [Fervidobacterium thailandense]